MSEVVAEAVDGVVWTGEIVGRDDTEGACRREDSHLRFPEFYRSLAVSNRLLSSSSTASTDFKLSSIDPSKSAVMLSWDR